jgi:hypothetical protein
MKTDTKMHTFRIQNKLQQKLMTLNLGRFTVAERSKAYTVFALSEAGIVGSNPSQGMDVKYM